MAESSSTNAFYASRPSLKLEGTSSPELAQGLLSLSVHENTQGLYHCEATFGNWGTYKGEPGFLYFDRQLLDFGTELKVSMGDSDAQDSVFAGKIMAIEGRFPYQTPPEILILAEDRFQDLRMTRRSRHFEAVSVNNIIETIASDHGLQTEIDLDSPDYATLTQVNQSDLAFLRDCARAVDAEIWVNETTIYAQARERRGEETLQLAYGKRLKEFSVIADLAQQCSSLVVSGWDMSAKQAFDHQATGSVLGQELGNDISGSSLLTQAFGERVEHRVHHVPQSVQETQSLAEAHYKQTARRFLTGRGMADGDARIRVGNTIRLEGLGALFNGAYYINEVIHSFDLTMGYRTYFNVEKAGLGAG